VNECSIVCVLFKGFFRRCIIQGLTQQCSNSESCEITPMTRNSCQYCRLKKCFAVGMSRGGKLLTSSSSSAAVKELVVKCWEFCSLTV